MLTRHYLSWRIFTAMAAFTVTFVVIAAIGLYALSSFQKRTQFMAMFIQLFDAASRLENTLSWSSAPARAAPDRATRLARHYRDMLALYLAIDSTGARDRHLSDPRWSALQAEYGIEPQAERARFGLSEGDMPADIDARWHKGATPGTALASLIGEFLIVAKAALDDPLPHGESAARELETLRDLAETRLMPNLHPAIHIFGKGITASASTSFGLLIACAAAGLLATALSLTAIFRPMQRKILENQAALVHERDRARTSERANRDFLAMMSHELRTPMNGIIGFTDLLLTTPITGKQREYGETIKESAHALLSLLNSILELSRIESGPLILDEADFSLEHVVSDVVTLLTPQALSKRLDLSAYIDPSLPQKLNGDEGRIRQILVNLVGNAIKFTLSGGVAIEVRHEGAAEGRHTLLISVTDTGIGLAKDQQQRIFERFTQVDSSTTRKFEGSGLGLSITRELVSRMGGEIGLESALDKGSTFWVRVTLGAAMPPATTLSECSRASFKGKRFLVVDDNALNRRIFRLQLEGFGAEVDCVADATAALVTLTQGYKRGRLHDLAIIDQMMPETDGLTLRKLIRDDPALAGVKLIISSSGGIGFDQQARALGFDAACPKPIIQDRLIAKIDELLAPRPVSAPSAPIMLLATKQATPRQTEPAATPEPDAPAYQPRLLVAEDNPINQRLIVTALRQARFVVEIASDGLEAVNAVQTGEYDAVLMDIRMPVMNGIEATQRIRALSGACSKVPIIAMTANAMVGDREEYLAAGMDDYVAKPIDFTILLSKIRARLPLGATDAPRGAGPAPEKKRG